MIGEMIALRGLLEKGSDVTLLREMIGFAAQRLVELETEPLCGAGHGVRSCCRHVEVAPWIAQGRCRPCSGGQAASRQEPDWPPHVVRGPAVHRGGPAGAHGADDGTVG